MKREMKIQSSSHRQRPSAVKHSGVACSRFSSLNRDATAEWSGLRALHFAVFCKNAKIVAIFHPKSNKKKLIPRNTIYMHLFNSYLLQTRKTSKIGIDFHPISPTFIQNHKNNKKSIINRDGLEKSPF